jgi:hypothetical protein
MAYSCMHDSKNCMHLSRSPRKLSLAADKFFIHRIIRIFPSTGKRRSVIGLYQISWSPLPERSK